MAILPIGHGYLGPVPFGTELVEIIENESRLLHQVDIGGGIGQNHGKKS